MKWKLFPSLLLMIALPLVGWGASLADKWIAGLKEVDQQLRAQQWQAAAERSRKMADEIVTTGGSDANVAYTLAVVSIFRALAEKGLGDGDAARWYCDVALALVPEIGKTDLKPYGALGEEIKRELLVSSEPAPKPPLEPGPEENARNEGVTRPVIRQQVKPVYPEGLSQLGVAGRVVAETVIDVDGRLKRCRVLEARGGGPAMTYAALDALRQWRFEPARKDGKPVKVYYVLTINFKVRK
jgi:TonB family protein